MQNKKIKLLFANTVNYCVPDVKGGAFATLVNNLVKCNEVRDLFDITVISLYDEKAEIESRQYSKSKFVYVKTNEKKEEHFRKSKWVKLMNNISFKIFRSILIPPPRLRTACYKIKGEEFDYIFGAGGDPAEYGWFTRKAGRKRMIFNVGGPLAGGKVAAKTFGNFICCSNYIKNYMRSNIEKCHIITILNRIDTKNFSQELTSTEKVDLQQKLGLQGKTIILFMGRISPEKGIEQLIDAFTQMKYKDNCVLLVAGAANFGSGGRTEFEEKIQKKVKQLRDNIKLLGFIHHKELRKIMKVSDMAVLPSIWEEPAGNVVPECMAAGLPLIITNSGGMVEYVNEETALIVEKKQDEIVDNLKNAMAYLYERTDIRKKMGEAAQKKSAEFDVMIYYDILYKELCHLQDNGKN